MPLKFEQDWLYPHVIPHHACFSPHRTAVICDGETLCWAELEARTRRVANALIAAGIAKGDTVYMFMKNRLTAFTLFWGIIRAGGGVVALNTMMSGEALAIMIDNSDGTILFVDESERPVIEPVIDRLRNIRRDRVYISDAPAGWSSAEAFIDCGGEAPIEVRIEADDSINIVYTSGSTGVPKGIEHSHLARHSYTFGMGHWFGFNRDSVALLATPLYANGTWATMGPCMYRGGTCELMPKFSGTGFLALVERHRCTHAFLVPTQLVVILAVPDLNHHDTSSLRIIDSAGQAATELARLSPHTEWQVYGLSEGFGTVIGPADRARGKTDSVGRPFVLDDIRIIGEDDRELSAGEIGEICGYSVGLMKGYYRDEAATEKMIWQGPGGRSKDMIKSVGIDVYSADIEEIFTRHPAVSEAAAIGVPHEKWIETPLLFVILRAGHSATTAEIKAWGNARIGKYQRVSAVEIVEDLPRVTYGKVDKKLRARFWPAPPTSAEAKGGTRSE